MRKIALFCMPNFSVIFVYCSICELNVLFKILTLLFTDESPSTCKMFLELNGLHLFIRVLTVRVFGFFSHEVIIVGFTRCSLMLKRTIAFRLKPKFLD